VKALNSVIISGREVLPLIEGGKGISITNGYSSGAWAATGGVGTFSGVFSDLCDSQNNVTPLIYKTKTRRERSHELAMHSIEAAISQAKIAYETSNGKGCVHMNILWGMASAETVLHGVLEKANKFIHGITAGAGMPYKLGEIAAKYKVYYYPIVSSARAFNILWKRAYVNFKDWLGAVVYEDPWKAGGHNGISNNENANVPEAPYHRVKALRDAMRELGLHTVPIVVAGGIWFLKEWENWIDNPELGPIAFQFGTRPLLTIESPISDAWKKKLLTLKREDISINHFSPTGFYSTSVSNNFIKELQGQSERQVMYSAEPTEVNSVSFPIGTGNRVVYINKLDQEKVRSWLTAGFTKTIRTPDSTLIFVTEDRLNQIRTDCTDCCGCLAYCRFSNWSENPQFSEGRIPDPRSYCIRKTLHDIAHNGSVEDNLMFSGSSGYLFSEDPFYANGFIPTVKQLVDRILTGN
jgi:nitronate monooxygenase